MIAVRVGYRILLVLALPAVLVAVWWVVTRDSTNFYVPPLSKILKAFGDTWFGDRMVLRQAMLNLLDNAIKYTPDGGTIEVRVRQETTATTIDVVDSGPGIPSELQPRIFDRFYRVDKSRSRENGGGTGLGLAIAKWAVEVSGGRLTLEPAPFGSRFRKFIASVSAARAPATIVSPSTSSALAKSEPRIEVWATTVWPAESAKRTTKSSGRLPSVDWSTPVAAGPNLLPTASVAIAISQASPPSAAPAITKTAVGARSA